MFAFVLGLAAGVLFIWPLSVESGEATLFARADSLAALDPVPQANTAIAAGDLRGIGLCFHACSAPGLSDSVPPSARRYHIVAGLSDYLTPGVSRLASVAMPYALAYNRVLLAELRRRRQP